MYPDSKLRKLQRVFDSYRAADPAAVSPFTVSGPDALNHYCIFRISHFPVCNKVLKRELRNHSLAGSVKIFLWHIFLCSCGNNHNAMREFGSAVICHYYSSEVSDVAGNIRYLR